MATALRVIEMVRTRFQRLRHVYSDDERFFVPYLVPLLDSHSRPSISSGSHFGLGMDRGVLLGVGFSHLERTTLFRLLAMETHPMIEKRY